MLSLSIADNLVGDIVVGADQRRVEEACKSAKVLAGPKIGNFAGLVDAGGGTHQSKVQGKSLRNVVVPIHDHGREVSVLLSTDHMNVGNAIENAGCLQAKRILINGD